MITRFFLFLGLLSLLSLSTKAQVQDIQLLRNARKVDIPFEYVNSFIIIEVLFNGIFPLRFIFDTGAENTVLTHREITDILRINYQRRFTIYGSDLNTELYAYLANGIQLKLGNQLLLNDRSILVLEEDYFRFADYAGIEVQGIIGADILKRFVVQINYQRRTITLHDPNHFVPPPPGKFESYPVDYNRYKPYISVPTGLPAQRTRNLKYLIDTGASLSLMLHANTDSLLTLPEKVVTSNIGMGLGGFLQGYAGRIPWMQVGDYRLEQIVTYFQELAPTVDTLLLNNRNGIIGNQWLERFVVIFDYPHEKLYLAPIPKYNQRFEFDRSGLNLAATGDQLRTFVVMSVSPGSPADQAGILAGDQIRSVNGVGYALLDLEGILRKLRGRTGKKIRVRIKRAEETLTFRFALKELI